MKLTNSTMWESIQVLSEAKETGKLGYACARNFRKLMEAAREYMTVRDKLLQKYGEPQDDGRYSFNSESAKNFTTELMEYAPIEHDVDVMTVPEDVFYSGNLTSKDMFALAWMVEEGS